MKKILILILIMNSCMLWGQEKKNYTISGYVVDESSKETLIGASIVDRLSDKGTVSNNYGFYSISLPSGAVTLSALYVGYSMDDRSFVLTSDTVINLRMQASATLNEVVIEAKKGALSNVENTQLGAISLTPDAIRNIPAIMGEVDLIKALQQLPGVTVGTEGFSGMYVRGGNKDENLYLIDGNPVYDVNHMFGFFSTFNPDAIKNTDFYKGSFPARYGGRLSSIIDVRTKDGNMEEYHGTFTIGLVSSKAQLEGPIIKDKASFNVAFRRTYLDLMLTPVMWLVNKSSDDKNYVNYHFYDLNAKLNYKFSGKSRMYLNLYSGDDALKVRQEWNYKGNTYDDGSVDYSTLSENGTKARWGNTLTSLNWNYIFNSQLFGNMSAIYSRFRSNIEIWDKTSVRETNDKVVGDDYYSMHYNSGIQDVGYRLDFDYLPRPNHLIKFGSNYLYHSFLPEESGMITKYTYGGSTAQADTVDYQNEKIHGHEFAVYAEDDINISSRLKANIGLNFSLFNVEGKSYPSLQPRLSARYLITDDFSAKASYARMSQYVHLLSSSVISMPTDLWVPVTKNIKPMYSNQFSAGLYYRLKDNYELSLEGYYKTMDNQIEYRDGSSFFSSSADWQQRVAMGNGTAYGLELLVQKTAGKTTGWVGYGLSWADRQFPGGEINSGNKYWAKYDNRHKVNIVVSHKLKKNMDINATWTYYTGNRMSVALESFRAPTVLPGGTPRDSYNGYKGNDIYYYDSRNNYKMSDYNRLDVGFNFYRPKKKGRMGIWNVSVYNVYCRMNTMMAYPSTRTYYKDGAFVTQPTMLEYSIFPILPSVSYTYKF